MGAVLLDLADVCVSFSFSFFRLDLEANERYSVRVLAATAAGFPRLQEDQWPWVSRVVGESTDGGEGSAENLSSLWSGDVFEVERFFFRWHLNGKPILEHKKAAFSCEHLKFLWGLVM